MRKHGNTWKLVRTQFTWLLFLSLKKKKELWKHKKKIFLTFKLLGIMSRKYLG